MAQQTINVKAQGYSSENAYQFRITANLTGKFEGNTREVEAYLDAYATNPGGYYNAGNSPKAYIFVNDLQKAIASVPSIWERGKWVRLVTWKGYIQANQTITIKGRYHPNLRLDFMPLYQNNDVTVSLTLSGVKSEFSGMNDFYIQDGLEIKINQYVTDFSQNLTISYLDEEETYENISNGYQINFTSQIQELMFNNMANNSNALPISLSLNTYNGENLIGTDQITINGLMKSTSETQPTILGFPTFQEQNNVVEQLTSNRKFIKNYSSVLVTLNPIATTKYNSTLDRVVINETHNMQINDDTATYILNELSSNTQTITVYDSRGLNSKVSATLELIDNYNVPILSDVQTERKDGVDEQVYLSFRAKLWNGEFGNGTNTISEFKYRIKKTTESVWSNWFDLTGEVRVAIQDQTVDNINVNNIRLYANEENANFDFGIGYDVQVYLKDGTTNNAFNQTNYVNSSIDDGLVLDSYNKTNTGYQYAINGIVNETLEDGLQVYGSLYINGKKQENIEFITDGEPVKCGYKIDGKDVYIKRVSVGNLPNATTKNVPHGLTNFTIIENPRGYATASDGTNTIPLPELHIDGLAYSVMLEVDETNIKIRAGSNRSDYIGYVDIYFVYNE